MHNAALLSHQIATLRRAMSEPTPNPADLLMVRDLDGRTVRPLNPPPGVTPRESAVLLLLFPASGELWLPLTVRSSRLTTHRGEVSLPGGGADPDDHDPAATALREAEEELGIDRSTVEVLGHMTSFYIPPSNNRLTPVVGLSSVTPHFKPDPHEVEAAFVVPLRQLFDPETIREEIWERQGLKMRVPFFWLEERKVWGATALLLSELVSRMRMFDPPAAAR
ncbi:MAG: CoA pyrophosphatase [Oscillochloris sp.]|nr:CoA pyrophosphatase [Oscillochloris sp.]